jgi:hypothetical protein
MRKINLLFAAVFVAAIALGGFNVFTAVDKKGVDTIDKKSAGVIDKNGIDTVDKKSINLVRRGRKIQVDGFLLEWRGDNANIWPGSNWRWDAVSTAEGIAGYVSLPAGSVNTGINIDNNPKIDTVNGHIINTDKNIIDSAITINNDTASSQSDWVITLRAVNTGRSLEINLPGQPSGEFFAFDKGEFDAGGPLTAEWIVPWEFFDDGGDSSEYRLLIAASGGGGVGALRPLVLAVEAPGEPQSPGGLLTRLVMIVLIAALTAALVVVRRRQMREKGL